MSSDWITSDEEFDEIAEELFDDEQEVASTATTVATPDNQAAGTPLPYVDQEVAEELVGDGPPTWLGMRWREIPEADQPAAWNGLRAWVDWLIKEYRLPTAVVPPCWYKHPDITAELYAGMNMEYKVWEEQAPSLSPMMFWHTNLQQMIYRLRQAVTTAGCVASGEHKPEPAHAHELDYDETDWNQHVTTAHSTQQFDRPNQGILYVRAGVVDSTGKTVAHSEPVGIKQPNPNEPLGVEIEYLSTNADYNVLEVHWQRHNDEQSLVWETSTDGQTWVEADENTHQGDNHDD